LRPDNAVQPVHHQTEQNAVRMPTAKHGEHLFALITFKIYAKNTPTPGILTPGNFLLDRSGGHVVHENHSTLWLEGVFGFPVDALTLYKLTKIH